MPDASPAAKVLRFVESLGSEAPWATREPEDWPAGAGPDAEPAEGTGVEGAAGAGRGVKPTIWKALIRTFAWEVPSAPHTGHATEKGMRPSTGSTSNLYFVPQSQKTLSSISEMPWLKLARS